MTVSSKDNRLVKEWRGLSADGKTRKSEQRFACEGARLCMDAALSGVSILTVLYTEKSAAQYSSQLSAILQVAKSAVIITPAIAQYMAETMSPQGIFCICEMPQKPFSVSSFPENGYLLALEDIQDPSNMGAIIRTAEALGFSALLLSNGCCDIYNSKVLRGSMGGVFRLPCMNACDFTSTVPALREAGYRCLACVPSEEAFLITQASLNKKTICLIGNEGNGLRPATIAACDGTVTIPMKGKAESLNAAMAAGIVMWEQIRQGE